MGVAVTVLFASGDGVAIAGTLATGTGVAFIFMISVELLVIQPQAVMHVTAIKDINSLYDTGIDNHSLHNRLINN
jgi:hypothetical protein